MSPPAASDAPGSCKRGFPCPHKPNPLSRAHGSARSGHWFWLGVGQQQGHFAAHFSALQRPTRLGKSPEGATEMRGGLELLLQKPGSGRGGGRAAVRPAQPHGVSWLSHKGAGTRQSHQGVPSGAGSRGAEARWDRAVGHKGTFVVELRLLSTGGRWEGSPRPVRMEPQPPAPGAPQRLRPPVQPQSARLRD